jgi:hypothetical protein
MNVEIIFEVCHARLGGTMSFPEGGKGIEFTSSFEGVS